MQVVRTGVSERRRSLTQGRLKLVLKPGPWRPWDIRKKPKQLARNPRQIASCLLIVVGCVLCASVAGTYCWMYVQQHMLLKKWNENSAGVNQNLVKLSIPRIQLEDVVLEGATEHSLLLGPAHLEGSAQPGSLGNAVIAGHRDTFFRRVHSLRYGDDIYVLRSGRRFHYVVRNRKIVEPTDLSVLKKTADSELTLITCYPTHAIGPAPQRLIVVAKLKSGA